MTLWVTGTTQSPVCQSLHSATWSQWAQGHSGTFSVRGVATWDSQGSGCASACSPWGFSWLSGGEEPWPLPVAPLGCLMPAPSPTSTCRLTLFPMEHHSLEAPLPSCPLPLPGLFLQPIQATCPLYQLHQIVWSPTHLHFLVPPHTAWVAPGAKLFCGSEPQLPSCEREERSLPFRLGSSMRRLCC